MLGPVGETVNARVAAASWAGDRVPRVGSWNCSIGMIESKGAPLAEIGCRKYVVVALNFADSLFQLNQRLTLGLDEPLSTLL